MKNLVYSEKVLAKQLKMKQKNKKEDFSDTIRAGEVTMKASEGTIRAGEGTIRASEDTIRVGQDFECRLIFNKF